MHIGHGGTRRHTSGGSLHPVAPCTVEPSTPVPEAPATGAPTDEDPLSSMNVWGQFVPSTAQPPVVFATDSRVVKAQEEVNYRERTLAQSPDWFGGRGLQENKLAEACQHLHELQPRKPVVLSATSPPKAGNVVLPPLQDSTTPAAATANATGPVTKDDSERLLSAAARRMVAVVQGAMSDESAPDLWRPNAAHLTTDALPTGEGTQGDMDAYLPSDHSAPAPAPPATAAATLTSALPRDSSAWNGGDGENLWPGNGGEDPSCLRRDFERTVNIAAAESRPKPFTGMPQHPPGPLPDDSDQSWFAGITALADRAFAQAGFPFAFSVQSDSDALATRTKEVHRAWFEAELRFQGHQSSQAKTTHWCPPGKWTEPPLSPRRSHLQQRMRPSTSAWTGPGASFQQETSPSALGVSSQASAPCPLVQWSASSPFGAPTRLASPATRGLDAANSALHNGQDNVLDPVRSARFASSRSSARTHHSSCRAPMIPRNGPLSETCPPPQRAAQFQRPARQASRQSPPAPQPEAPVRKALGSNECPLFATRAPRPCGPLHDRTILMSPCTSSGCPVVPKKGLRPRCIAPTSKTVCMYSVPALVTPL